MEKILLWFEKKKTSIYKQFMLVLYGIYNSIKFSSVEDKSTTIYIYREIFELKFENNFKKWCIIFICCQYSFETDQPIVVAVSLVQVEANVAQLFFVLTI